MSTNTLRGTLTVEQIKWLRQAINMAEEWKGNHDPESYDEFDSWIAKMRTALKQVTSDRKRLRELLR